MFYASLPIMVYALLDKEHKGRDFVNNPEYYEIGLKNKLFKRSIFWYWIVMGAWQACLICFATYYIFTCITSEDYILDIWASGMTIYGSVILVANIKIILFSNTFSLLSMSIIILSVLFYYSNYVLESYLYTTGDVFDSFERFVFFYNKLNTLYYFSVIGLLTPIIFIFICSLSLHQHPLLIWQLIK